MNEIFGALTNSGNNIITVYEISLSHIYFFICNGGDFIFFNKYLRSRQLRWFTDKIINDIISL